MSLYVPGHPTRNASGRLNVGTRPCASGVIVRLRSFYFFVGGVCSAAFVTEIIAGDKGCRGLEGTPADGSADHRKGKWPTCTNWLYAPPPDPVSLVDVLPISPHGRYLNHCTATRAPRIVLQVSAARGSPVVSVSIGDACDFAYKDDPGDTERCVVLGSGDVLVFGGPSRLIMHAVPKIYPNTCPKGLVMPQKGRLNLTFRQQDHG